MSILFKNETGFYLSHKINIEETYKTLNKCLNPDLFNINQPYKKAKVSEVNDEEVLEVKVKFEKFIKDLKSAGFFNDTNETCDNCAALRAADRIYNDTEKLCIKNILGGNSGPAKEVSIENSMYLFPEDCVFYSKNVEEMDNYLKDVKFDLILLDPPWWNKYIRRKRKIGDAYTMMHNNQLKSIQIENLIHKDSLVAVWCTNSPQNIQYLIRDVFPKWNVNYLTHWYWIKITTNGIPICDFSQPPRKQPFERIVFAAPAEGRSKIIEEKKLIVSVPSALHSHKPPLNDVLREFLPEKPKCLEVFARYLLPGWTSYGNQVLKLQQECVYSDNKLY